MNKKATTLSLVCIVGALGGLGAGLVAAQAQPESAATLDQSPNDPLVRGVRGTMKQFGGDTIEIAGPEGASYFAQNADFEAMVRAGDSRNLGREFDRSALVIPVVDEKGDLAGYFAQGAGFLRREVVESPGFDLCAVTSATATDFFPDGTTVERKLC